MDSSTQANMTYRSVPIPETWYDGLSKGVNFTLAGTGGSDCVGFIPFERKVWETLFAFSLSIFLMFAASKKVTLDTKSSHYSNHRVSGLQQFVLASLCLTFGVEIGYKLSTSTTIWLLNPCHILTFVEIILLAAPPSKWVTAVFRVQMHAIHGAVVAILLPVTNTRMLPFEVVVYWVQHVMIVTVPFFLISRGGPYTTEPLRDFSWTVLSLGGLVFFYWIPVQGICIWSQVNLNNMVCPAISDPFYGVNYRLWAMTHCTICILFFGKLYTWLSLTILGKQRNAIPEEHNGILRNGVQTNGQVNGHSKVH